MTPDLLAALALAVLALHVAVIAFNVFGLIAIPLGGLLDWQRARVLVARPCTWRCWRSPWSRRCSAAPVS